jgi:hypothetical protein
MEARGLKTKRHRRVASALVVLLCGALGMLASELAHQGNRSVRGGASGKDAPPRRHDVAANRAAARRNGSPTFLASSSSPAVQTVPGQPGYDPTRFLSVMPAGDIYAQEPRNEPWAAKVESWLADRARRDLARAVPELEELEVECRTTMCRYTWTAPGFRSRAIRDMIGALLIGSGAGEPTATGGASPLRPGQSEMYVAYAGGVLADLPPGATDELFRTIEENRQP